MFLRSRVVHICHGPAKVGKDAKIWGPSLGGLQYRLFGFRPILLSSYGIRSYSCDSRVVSLLDLSRSELQWGAHVEFGKKTRIEGGAAICVVAASGG